MPINSRNKGAQFERDVANILNGFFSENNIDFKAKRNLDQYQQKELCDLDIPFHAVECKFYKEGEWLKSACNESGLARGKRQNMCYGHESLVRRVEKKLAQI